MKLLHKILVFSLILGMLYSCSSDEGASANPFLPAVNFSFEANLSLPQYSALEFAGNHVVDRTAGRGIQGVVIFNLNGSSFAAFELSDPNVRPSECSVLAINGVEASAPCGNGNVYNIATGQRTAGEGEFPLLRYRIQREGNSLFISN